MIVGWRVASHMRTDMALDALEMARRSRGAGRLVGLVAHSDAGSQFTSVRFTERLDEIGSPSLHKTQGGSAAVLCALSVTSIVMGEDAVWGGDGTRFELPAVSRS